MKKLLNFILVALMTVNFVNAQSKIKVPYFDKMTAMEICGETTNFCQPTSSEKWAPVKGKIFKGKIEYELFRSFKNTIFETAPCPNAKLTDKDFVSKSIHKLQGSVASIEKQKFDEKIKANLTDLINKYFTSLSKSIKADIEAELVKNIKKETSQKIKLEYRTYDLTDAFIDDQLENCLSSIPKGQKVVTGISVLTIDGSWTTNTLKQTFANFEANVTAYDALTLESKNQYEKDKQTILTGDFEPLSVIFAVAYRKN